MQTTSQLTWDRRFLELAKLVASWSKDPSTQCGAVITQGKHVIGIGYNGFPRGVIDHPLLLNNREEKYQRVIHAEMNAILNCKHDLANATLFTWPFACCARCAAMIIQTGVKRVVSAKTPQALQDRWSQSLALALEMFDEADVDYKLYSLADLSDEPQTCST